MKLSLVKPVHLKDLGPGYGLGKKTLRELKEIGVLDNQQFREKWRSADGKEAITKIFRGRQTFIRKILKTSLPFPIGSFSRLTVLKKLIASAGTLASIIGLILFIYHQYLSPRILVSPAKVAVPPWGESKFALKIINNNDIAKYNILLECLVEEGALTHRDIEIIPKDTSQFVKTNGYKILPYGILDLTDFEGHAISLMNLPSVNAHATLEFEVTVRAQRINEVAKISFKIKSASKSFSRVYYEHLTGRSVPILTLDANALDMDNIAAIHRVRLQTRKTKKSPRAPISKTIEKAPGDKIKSIFLYLFLSSPARGAFTVTISTVSTSESLWEKTFKQTNIASDIISPEFFLGSGAIKKSIGVPPIPHGWPDYIVSRTLKHGFFQVVLPDKIINRLIPLKRFMVSVQAKEKVSVNIGMKSLRNRELLLGYTKLNSGSSFGTFEIPHLDTILIGDLYPEETSISLLLETNETQNAERTQGSYVTLDKIVKKTPGELVREIFLYVQIFKATGILAVNIRDVSDGSLIWSERFKAIDLARGIQGRAFIDSSVFTLPDSGVFITSIPETVSNRLIPMDQFIIDAYQIGAGRSVALGLDEEGLLAGKTQGIWQASSPYRVIDISPGDTVTSIGAYVDWIGDKASLHFVMFDLADSTVIWDEVFNIRRGYILGDESLIEESLPKPIIERLLLYPRFAITASEIGDSANVRFRFSKDGILLFVGYISKQ